MTSKTSIKQVYFIKYLDSKETIVDNIEWGDIPAAIDRAVSIVKAAHGNIHIPQFFLSHRVVEVASPPPPPIADQE